MNSRAKAAAAAAVGMLVLGVALRGFAAEVPPYDPKEAAAEEGVAPQPIRMWLDEERRLIVEDRANRCRLSLPAPYWECETAAQIAGRRASAGGCAGAPRVPLGLLFVAENKDAPAAAAGHVLPERFLLRRKEDLEGYVDALQQQFASQPGGKIEAMGSEEPYMYFQPDGIAVHRSLHVKSVDSYRQVFLVVRYFVRPAGEDVLVYRLICTAPEEEFERQREDFEHMAASFEFIGDLSEEFFVDDAPAEKLPDLGATARRPGGACGQGYPGVLMAFFGVLVLYVMLRRRKRRPA